MYYYTSEGGPQCLFMITSALETKERNKSNHRDILQNLFFLVEDFSVHCFVEHMAHYDV